MESQMRKAVILAYTQGVQDTLTEGDENQKLVEALKRAIANYKKQPLYTREATSLEEELNKTGVFA